MPTLRKHLAYCLFGVMLGPSSACGTGDVPLHDYPPSELQLDVQEHWVDFEGMELDVTFMRLFAVPSAAWGDEKRACPTLADSTQATFNGLPLEPVSRGGLQDLTEDGACMTPHFRRRFTDREYGNLSDSSTDATVELFDENFRMRLVAADYFKRRTLRPSKPSRLEGIRVGDTLELERSPPGEAFINSVSIYFQPATGTEPVPPLIQPGPPAGEPLRLVVPSQVPSGPGKLSMFGHVQVPIRECSGVEQCAAEKRITSDSVPYSLSP